MWLRIVHLIHQNFQSQTFNKNKIFCTKWHTRFSLSCVNTLIWNIHLKVTLYQNYNITTTIDISLNNKTISFCFVLCYFSSVSEQCSELTFKIPIASAPLRCELFEVITCTVSQVDDNVTPFKKIIYRPKNNGCKKTHTLTPLNFHCDFPQRTVMCIVFYLLPPLSINSARVPRIIYHTSMWILFFVTEFFFWISFEMLHSFCNR